jgi:hypothetical protein
VTAVAAAVQAHVMDVVVEAVEWNPAGAAGGGAWVVTLKVGA